MVRKAFLVGINSYSSPITPLRGPVEDVSTVRKWLLSYYGFGADEILCCLDAAATRSAILRGARWLLNSAQAGDVLLFFFSGHGSQVAATTDEELDVTDEVLVTADQDWDSPLRDNDLRVVFDQAPCKVNLSLIFDCCHSGGMLMPADPGRLVRSVRPPEPIAAAIAVRRATIENALAARIRHAEPGLHSSAMPNLFEAVSSAPQAHESGIQKSNRFLYASPDGPGILLAACREDQTCEDAVIAGRWQGVFTHHLDAVIQSSSGRLTYAELVAQVGTKTRQYRQVPQLLCRAEAREMSFLSSQRA